MDTMILSSHSNQNEQDVFRTMSLTALLGGSLHLAALIIHTYFISGQGADLKLAGSTSSVSFLNYLMQGGPEYVCRHISVAVFDPSTNEKLLLAWGLVFHYMIAFLFTVFLFLIYPVVARLIKYQVAIIILYGLFTWVIMNHFIIPFTHHDRIFPGWKETFIEQSILTFTIGLPVAWRASRYQRHKRNN